MTSLCSLSLFARVSSLCVCACACVCGWVFVRVCRFECASMILSLGASVCLRACVLLDAFVRFYVCFCDYGSGVFAFFEAWECLV